MPRKKLTKVEQIGVATKALKTKLVQELKEIPIPTFVCQKLGVPKATYYKWKQTDSAFQEACDEAVMRGKLNVNDLAKSKLIKLINDGDYRSISFWLKHNDPDFNPRLTLEIQEVGRKYDPVQLKEMADAMQRAGLVGVTLAHQEMERKFRELESINEKRAEEKSEYLDEGYVGKDAERTGKGIKFENND